MERRQVALNGCWEWPGRLQKGYGFIRHEGRTQGVHRVSFLLLVGSIPPGLVVDHHCHNLDESCKGGPTCRHRRCWNPDHLRLATIGDNSRAGRTGAYLAERSHCPAGHPYAEFGVRYPSSNGRECRECKRLRSAEFDAKRRASGYWPNAKFCD